MKKTIIGSVFFLLSFISFGQAYNVSGKVKDTAERKYLHQAAICLLRSIDSTLYSFTRTNAEGIFKFTDIPKGEYLLLISYPGYADYIEKCNLSSQKEMDFGLIPMILRTQLLEEVIVRQKLGAIRIKKDTTEFIADSFKLDAYSNVEDLLKRLPGVKVNKDGSIEAQGEEVKKVLVDGEEFFGDDPTMATRNLRADAVDRVQVFDKKSDQASFTGIDDGQKSKTINIKLKEDKKKGFFGKIGAGGGIKDKFNNEAMINAFKGKRKIAAYGVMANNGKTGLGWEDRGKFGGNSDMNMEIDESSGMIMMWQEGDEFGNESYWGEGLPTSWASGLHYSNKFNEEKKKLNLNYRFNKLNVQGGGFSNNQYILPDTFYYRNDRGNSFSTKLRNQGSGTYDWQLDSNTSVKLNFTGSLGTSQSNNYYTNEALNAKKINVNKSFRNTGSDGTNEQFNSGLLYKQKFHKKGRTFSLQLSQKYSRNESQGFLSAENDFYDINGSFTRMDSINQKKTQLAIQNILSSKASFTEGIGKKGLLEFNYSISSAKDQTEKMSYDKMAGGFSNYIDSLSTRYKFDVFTQLAGSSIRWNDRIFAIQGGGTISSTQLKQFDLLRDSIINYNYLNFFPKASFNWNIKPNQSSMRIAYNGSTRQPSINDLQPSRDNSDPLYIRKGNPNLQQEFNHDVSLSFNSFQVMKNRSFWGQISFTNTQNAISSSDWIDKQGRRISQPINTKNRQSGWLYFSYNSKWKKTGIEWNLGARGSSSSSISFINGIANENKNNGIGIRGGLDYRKENKISVSLRIEQTLNNTISSINKNLNNAYWTSEISPEASMNLSKKTILRTDALLNFRQRTTLFNNNRNVMLWNASLDQKIFKDQSGMLQIQVTDILNQNIGFSRDFTSTTNSERTYDTLKRIWMLKLIWNFTKNGPKL